MERNSDDDGADVDDHPPDNADDDESQFVEVDPSGRYGRYDEVLGKGAHKTVYKAFDEIDGIEVAWNQVKVHDMLQNAGDMERLYSEVHLLKTLKHKNIIKFHNSWIDSNNNNVNFITEIFTSGTLRQYRKKHKHVDLKAIKSWSRQILRGLLYLHSHDPPIIHRDLKCDNIFINGNQGEVKIGDLGLATILRQAHAAHSVIGTPEFMAPELYEEEYNELVDIYSFGMCLLEMITFEYPYSECTNAAQIYKKVTGGIRPAALKKVKDLQVREFVEKCLVSASQRLHARELLMDPFLQSDGELEFVEAWQRQPTISNPCEILKKLDAVPEEACLLQPNFEEHEHVSAFMDVGSTQVVENSNVSLSMGMPLLLEERRVRISNDIPTNKLPNMSDARSPKQGLKRNRDFKIKCKKQDDKRILVRIQITSSRGGVRYIQFDFDLEADTAMCVASEMVTELDLSDQDVTTIAEMIDSEIVALVPDWKPGVAIDEAGGDEVSLGEQQQGTPLVESPMTHRCYNGFSPLALENSLICLTPGVETTKIGDLEVLSCPRSEGLMHGRFEEVGRCRTGAVRTQQESDPFIFFSDSSDQLEGGGSDLSIDMGLDRPIFETGLNNSLTSEIVEETRVDAKSESQSFCSTMDFREAPKGVSKVSAGVDLFSNGGGHKFEKILNSSMGFSETDLHDEKQQHFSLLFSEDETVEDVGAEELRFLTLQHEQEIRLLQSKHEQALLELKIRLQSQGGLAMRNTVSSGEPMQDTPGLVASLVCLNGSGCQAKQYIDPQNRHVKVMDHELNGLDATPVTGTVEESEIDSRQLARVPAGTSPLCLSGYKVCAEVRSHDFISETETLFQEKSSNVSSKHATGNLDIAQSEVLIGGPEESESLTALSGPSHFTNVTSMDLRQGIELAMASSTNNMIMAGGGVIANGSGQFFTSLTELQMATVDITEGETFPGSIVDNPGNGADLVLVEMDETENTSNKTDFWLDGAWDIDVKVAPVYANDSQSETMKADFSTSYTDKEVATPGARAQPDTPQSRVQSSHATLKPGWTSLAKHESYLELYKAGVTQKEKVTPKPSVFPAIGEISTKVASSKNNDQEQLKKEQLQKSIAELEARTLEGLCQSKSKYLASSAARNHVAGTVQSGQPSSTSTHVRQYTAPEITRA